MAQALKCVPLKPEGLSVRLSSADYSCSILQRDGSKTRGNPESWGAAENNRRENASQRRGRQGAGTLCGDQADLKLIELTPPLLVLVPAVY